MNKPGVNEETNKQKMFSMSRKFNNNNNIAVIICIMRQHLHLQ